MFREGSFNWLKKDKKPKTEDEEENFIDKDETNNEENTINESGLNNNPHPLARSKAELHPYKHTDNPVTFGKGDIISESKGTGNPEDEMIAEEEAGPDPYAKYNAQGDTRPPEEELSWDEQREDEEYFRKIEEIGEKGDNRKEDVVLKPGTKGDNEPKTPAQIKKETKIKKIEERWWYDESRPNRDRGQQPIRKNKPTGIRKILGK